MAGVEPALLLIPGQMRLPIAPHRHRTNALPASRFSARDYHLLAGLFCHRAGKTLPSDESIRPYLVRDKGYNETSVLDVIRIYRETFELAKLGDLGNDNSNELQSGTVKSAQNPQFASPNPAAMNAAELKELPILVGDGRIAKIPFPMSNDDFDLLLGTLNLWKKKLIRKEPDPAKDDAGQE